MAMLLVVCWSFAGDAVGAVEVNVIRVVLIKKNILIHLSVAATCILTMNYFMKQWPGKMNG